MRNEESENKIKAKLPSISKISLVLRAEEVFADTDSTFSYLSSPVEPPLRKDLLEV